MVKKKVGKATASQHKMPFYLRRMFVVLVFAAMGFSVIARAAYLQVTNQQFFQGQGDARHVRTVELPAHRGMIVDRNGEPLAVSTPVDSVWVNPKRLANQVGDVKRLAKVLNMSASRLSHKLKQRQNKEFLYIKRRVEPHVADLVRELKISGVGLEKEYRRFYPAGETFSHVVGFTDVDDFGQEGLELAFDDWLRGEPGAKRVLKDRYGQSIEDIENIKAPRPGKDLVLSIDRRLQYLAYRELKAQVLKHKAKSGSAVLMDARNGEVLAMVNQPAYNPNDKSSIKYGAIRNRAVTDVFEPGSTVKPFTVAQALASGQYTLNSKIDTRPGFMRVSGHQVKDHRNYGVIDLTTVITKSSNVASGKIALSLGEGELFDLLKRAGFGEATGVGFPGELSGKLEARPRWYDIDKVALSFGYGFSATTLQLASAYAAIANDGKRPQVSLLKRRAEAGVDKVMSENIARHLVSMMETVVTDEGTARKARIEGYRVAGKTGTVKKAATGGYAEDKYLSVFAGLAPASDPRLVMVVMIDEPKAGEFYGGAVAAPVFKRVMESSLRLLNVAPDDLGSLRLAKAEG